MAKKKRAGSAPKKAAKKSAKKAAKKTTGKKGTGKKAVGKKAAGKKAAKKKPATKKTAKKHHPRNRETIKIGSDTRYVRRNELGEFQDVVEKGRSLAQDRRMKSKTVVPAGQGDRGDQAPRKKKR